MRHLKIILALCFCTALAAGTFAQSRAVGTFKKIIISPYIQVTYVQGDKESVTINSTIVDSNKLHIEVQDGTLRIYLEGAKDVPHNQHENNGNGNTQSYPLYPNHAVIATVTYKTLEVLSVRGEETHLLQSPITTEDFTLRVYGDSKIIFTEVHIGEMNTTMYGESTLDIKSGSVNLQHYTCYGEGKVNATAVTGKESKITAYGEAELNLNVSDRIKIIAFGEAKLRYMGNPAISKGLHIGALDVKKID